jgi:hypothetical protein
VHSKYYAYDSNYNKRFDKTKNEVALLICFLFDRSVFFSLLVPTYRKNVLLPLATSVILKLFRFIYRANNFSWRLCDPFTSLYFEAEILILIKHKIYYQNDNYIIVCDVVTFDFEKWISSPESTYISHGKLTWHFV